MTIKEAITSRDQCNVSVSVMCCSIHLLSIGMEVHTGVGPLYHISHNMSSLCMHNNCYIFQAPIKFTLLK